VGRVKVGLKHVVTDMDRHGNARIYVRRPGSAKIRIRELPGSPAFLAAYEAAVRGDGPAPRKVYGERRPEMKDGTLAALARKYFASPEFGALEIETQRNRRLIVEHCLGEPVRAGSPDIMGETSP
jgi:hypothetical protein